jgi:CheY-like chemotaxis protein
MKSKPEVLCVDDEPEVLEGLRLHLKRHCVVHTLGSGAEALDFLRDNRNVAVILSDMRMPVMDGAKFLNAARSVAPEAVRMLLTGYSDVESAIAAVNEGQIFRFISKPCPPDQLLAAMRSGIDQHELLVAERVLLQQTLLGCVESLAKVLSVTRPVAFGRALRLRAKVRSVLENLGLQGQWQIEAAAMLSQLGAVTLPEELLMKLNEGDALDAAEREELAGSLETSVQMLENIPRLEPVLAILQYLTQQLRGQLPAGSNSAPPGAMLLRLILEWDQLEASGCSQAEALGRLSAQGGIYDQETLDALKRMPAPAAGPDAPRATAVRDLVPGMVLAEDLVRANGVMILPRGFEIDRGLLDHVLTFAGDFDGETVKVLAR